MTIHARTERLILREWSKDDVESYSEIVSDPDVMQYIGDGQPRTREHAESFVAEMMAPQWARGWMRFTVEHAASGR